MTSKTPATISVVLTVILLILLAILSVFIQMLALNDASQSKGTLAMGISIGCQGAVIILAGIFAGRLTNFLIAKWNWNKALAVTVTVILGTILGAAFSFLSILIAISLTGIG
jgi:membrane protease YdiL (CAAX protease family)